MLRIAATTTQVSAFETIALSKRNMLAGRGLSVYTSESTGIQLVHYRSELSSDPVSDERDLEVISCRLDLFV